MSVKNNTRLKFEIIQISATTAAAEIFRLRSSLSSPLNEERNRQIGERRE
jgi:hypothetical protein